MSTDDDIVVKHDIDDIVTQKTQDNGNTSLPWQSNNYTKSVESKARQFDDIDDMIIKPDTDDMVVHNDTKETTTQSLPWQTSTYELTAKKSTEEDETY